MALGRTSGSTFLAKEIMSVSLHTAHGDKRDNQTGRLYECMHAGLHKRRRMIRQPLEKQLQEICGQRIRNQEALSASISNHAMRTSRSSHAR